MFKRKKKKEKYSLEEYREMQKALERKHFRFTPYPWPVMIALLFPVALFILIIISYILYIRNSPA